MRSAPLASRRPASARGLSTRPAPVPARSAHPLGPRHADLARPEAFLVRLVATAHGVEPRDTAAVALVAVA
eukprot:1672195-Alexandrium_andersonii.AAC.1